MLVAVQPHCVSATAELPSYCQHSATPLPSMFCLWCTRQSFDNTNLHQEYPKWLETELWNEIGKQYLGDIYPSVWSFGYFTQTIKVAQR